MEIKIISKKLIKPSIPTPSHLQNMKLSIMDLRLPPLTVPYIYYYTAHENYHPFENVERLKRLKKSLSEILTLYYPLAGRYVKESQLINCNDEGVEFVEALVSGKLSQILQGQFEMKDLNCFIPDAVEESATSPQLAVQINIFSCGGLAIGLRTSHRMIDGFTTSLFTNGWAKTCKVGNTNDVIVPKFESGILFPPRDTPLVNTPSPPLVNAPSPPKTCETVTRRFVFDAKTILKLRAEVMSGSGHKHKISTTEVVAALIWKAEINADRAIYGSHRTSLLAPAINLRGITSKKIPENCCGNIYTHGTTIFQGDDTKMGLNDLVDLVRDSIRNTIVEFGKLNEDDDESFSKLIESLIMAEAEQNRKGEGDILWFSSLRNFPFYEADFGWGKLDWMSFTSMPNKVVFILGTKDRDGIEAWVTMDEDKMTYFQNDPSITMSLKVGDGIPVSEKSLDA